MRAQNEPIFSMHLTFVQQRKGTPFSATQALPARANSDVENRTHYQKLPEYLTSGHDAEKAPQNANEKRSPLSGLLLVLLLLLGGLPPLRGGLPPPRAGPGATRHRPPPPGPAGSELLEPSLK